MPCKGAYVLVQILQHSSLLDLSKVQKGFHMCQKHSAVNQQVFFTLNIFNFVKQLNYLNLS